MYQKIRCTVGAQVFKLAPIKSTTGELLLDKHQQLDRWVEHYSALYSEDEHVLRNPPLMAKLDAEPSMEDSRKPSMSSLLAKVLEMIPAELLKVNSTCLSPHLYNLTPTSRMVATRIHLIRYAQCKYDSV